MQRKIVQHGASSLTVSLPHRFVKEFNIKKGDDVFLEQQGKTLLLRIQNEKKKISTTLHYKKNNVFLKRHLLNLYRLGYDEITLTFEDTVPLNEILDKLDELLGFEIVDQTDTKCVIKNVANVLEEEFDIMLKRLFIITLSFFNTTVTAIQKSDYALLKNFHTLEKENNKIVNYLQRVLNKGGFEETVTVASLVSLTNCLEQIGDALGDLSEKLLLQKSRPNQKTVTILIKMHDYFTKVYISYFSTKRENIVDLKKMRVYLKDTINELLLEKQDSIILAHMLLIVEQLHHIEISL